MTNKETKSDLFKDESEKTLVLLIVILSMITGFLASLVVWALKKDELCENARSFVRNLLNFELTLLCVCVLFIIPFIGPLLAYLGAPVLWVVNVVYCIMAAVAISNSKTLSLPSYEFIKK